MIKLITSSIALALVLLCSGCGGGGGGGGLSMQPPGRATTTPSTGGGGGSQGGLGPGASLAGRRPFPTDNPWNQDISSAPVDPNSSALIASIGTGTGLHPDFGTVWNGAPIGIPYVVVSGTQSRVPVSFDYADESDPGPYPVPPNPPIEGGANSSGDRHILIVDRDNWKLYELFAAYPSGSGWDAGSGAVFDLNSNQLRPAGWTFRSLRHATTPVA